VVRADAVATTCRNMARSIRTAYGREADIINALIRIADYRMGEGTGEYYLSVSRLISHKRVDVAVRACTHLGRRLIVVGDGPERARLQHSAGASVSFAGRVDDATLRDLYAGCRALIFCSDEDYGLAPLEAQASGRPVIAFGSGGVLETVRDGDTGLFFSAQHAETLVDAIQAFERLSFDPARVRTHAQQFDVEPFIESLRAFVFGSQHRPGALATHAELH